MSARTVLLLPQNDSHAETTVLLGSALEAAGVHAVVLDMDDVFHQGTRGILEGMDVLPSGLATEQPFYLMSRMKQVRLVSAAGPRARGWIAGIDGVVAFNDGALQRLVLRAARQRSLSTDLILDGMLTHLDFPWTVASVVRAALERAGRALDGTNVASFLPSALGLTQVDRAHVPGRHSAEVLRSKGSHAGRIVESGLPRWPNPEGDPPSRVRNLLYLTGSFRWHGDAATARAQVRDLAELEEVCVELGLPLTIRIHPRDDDRYDGLRATFVDPRAEPMTETIRRFDLVLSIVSTGLVEAVLLNRPSRALAIHPSWHKYRRSFVAAAVFGAIRSRSTLRAELQAMMASVDPSAMERQRREIAPYVAATGTEATRRITSEIVAGVGGAIAPRRAATMSTTTSG